ncbi:MAG: VWA domain-containing protein [Xanthobacteraceae bacterium]|mgnify:CR=1 FL=1|nr:VWA domain-containing protein [Xanthobacteraceae bacterium]QYK43812.1 MAG: VWA domain-containing protein [Xanthobacteraceae bacterium]HMN51318.1 VWA domain-containing protein [Xanthobacteraceae bacterium]
MANTRDKTPATRAGESLQTSQKGEIDAFLAKARTLGPRSDGKRGRLAFALDATMSRQPTWDLACKLQAEMFEEAGAAGGLDVQLIYFRGLRECRASRWTSDAKRLGEVMASISCQGGHTQIGRVLEHVRAESKTAKVDALVYVGDAMEEAVDDLCAAAGELGLLGIPAFMFQEGGDPVAENAFREIARLTKGAWCPFDAGAASQLKELLRAAAAYAAGGHRALSDLSKRGGRGAVRLIEQMR